MSEFSRTRKASAKWREFIECHINGRRMQKRQSLSFLGKDKHFGKSVYSAFRREDKREVSLLSSITRRHVSGVFLELYSETMRHNRHELQCREISVGY